MGKDMQYSPNLLQFSLEAVPRVCLWPPAPAGIGQSWVRSGDYTIALVFSSPKWDSSKRISKFLAKLASSFD